MKRYICAALAAALLLPGMWAVSARAQDDDAPPPEQSEHHDGGKPDGAKMAEHMKKHLGLTDEQAAKFKDAMKAHGEAMKPLWQSAKDAMKKLAEQLKSKAPDADIQTSLDGLKAAHKAIAAEEEKFRDGLASFLTPTQRAKMAVGMAKRMQERGPRGKHGPKGGDKDDDEKGGDHDGGGQ
jgi:Spy/CpxP family protein refolding chaperone